MSEDALFEGYDDATAQWRADRMQLVNWGGFHGHHSIDFAPDATLISGASGTGKSTILDAYLALMMPGNVPFNGASNDAISGRARSASQRNVLSYLRGKIDSTRDAASGALNDVVLRAADKPVWGALSITFTDDSERSLTALRTYYAPAGATSPNEVRVGMFTLPTTLDLRQLEPFAESRFDVRAMRGAFPSLERFEAATHFIEYVTTRLGIGGAGGGDRALRLLARVQAGHQVKTVDRLYKDLVLERPATYDAADRALEQFRALSQTHDDIVISEQKRKTLEPIRDLYQRLENSRETLKRLDRLGTHQVPSAFQLWSLRTEWDVLDRAEAASRIARGDAEARATAARARSAALSVRIQEVEQQRRDNGGGALERITARIDEAEVHVSQIESTRARFLQRIAVLEPGIIDAESFASLREQAAEFLPTVTDEAGGIQAQRDADVTARVTPMDQLRELKVELRSLDGRSGRVPLRHDKARRDIAREAGLDPRDLPFAAELMDVSPDYADWRRAAEDTLRGIGLTLLMDERRAGAVRRVMDRFVAGDLGELGIRLHNEAVELDVPLHLPDDERYLSGRLVFAESPFTGWLADRVSSTAIDHLCVDSPDDLRDDEPSVTQNGQTRRGSRGAHGRGGDHQDILGFSNEGRRGEILAQIAALEASLDELDAAVRARDLSASALRERADAFRFVLDTAWASIDLTAAAAALGDLQRQHAALLAKSDVLRELDEQHAQLINERREHEAAATLAEAEHKRLSVDWDEIVDRKDLVATGRDEIERSELVSLADADADDLNARAARLGGGTGWRDFSRSLELVRTSLTDELRAASDLSKDLAGSLTLVFETFNRSWPDPNRDSSLDAYPEYEAIYADIVHHGLPARLEAFKRNFQKWSGDDLKILGDQYHFALDAIEERLVPINRILQNTPFGAGGTDRLRIDLRRRTPEYLAAFLRSLDRLRQDVSTDVSDAEMEARFVQLQEIMSAIDVGENGSTDARDRLLDVRQHIEISATRVDEHGEAISTYTDIAGKSGGETQELIAFIVGAALRYQLGDEARSRPRFAPVILDEGFVKSDSEFAGRAVTAWRDLGFQLIIAAPLDKVSALEPYMERMWSVIKNDKHQSFVRGFREVDEG